jgi:hypothetical protein
MLFFQARKHLRPPAQPNQLLNLDHGSRPYGFSLKLYEMKYLLQKGKPTASHVLLSGLSSLQLVVAGHVCAFRSTFW